MFRVPCSVLRIACCVTLLPDILSCYLINWHGISRLQIEYSLIYAKKIPAIMHGKSKSGEFKNGNDPHQNNPPIGR